MQYSGIDFYDDGGKLLRETIPFSDIPDFVKTASMVDSSQTTPDDYAVVVLDGGRSYPKFPRTDPGNTVISAHYLLNGQDGTPDPVIKTAAMNLASACRGFGLGIPEELLKLAGIPGEPDLIEDVTPYVEVNPHLKIQGKKEKKRPMSAKRPAGVKKDDKAGVGSDDAQLKTANVAKVRANLSSGMSPEAAVREAYPDWSDAQVSKVAAKLGSEKTAEATVTADVGGRKIKGPKPVKTKTFRLPKATTVGARTLLRVGKSKKASAPYDHTVAAATHFNENWKRIHPYERAKLAQALVPECRALGIDLIPEAYVYAEGVVDPRMVKVAVRMRRALWPNEEVYTMLEKAASMMSPTDAVEAIFDADVTTGMSRFWDSKLPDPFLSTMVKKAAEEKTFIIGNDHVTEGQLKALADTRLHMVKKHFGEDFAKQFSKNPATVFNSLPLDTKCVLARMSQTDQGMIEDKS